MDIKDLQLMINKTVKELEKLEELKMKIIQTVTFDFKWSDENEDGFRELAPKITIDKQALEKIVVELFLIYNEMDMDEEIQKAQIIWK